MSEKKTTKSEIIEKLKENQVIKDFSDHYITGGAIIDIAEGRIPKDYDFIIKEEEDEFVNKCIELDYELVSKTMSAITFKKGKTIVQGIFKDSEEFEYEISRVRFKYTNDFLDRFDEASFLSKVLIPTDYSFKNPYNALLRVPHWQRKGYKLPDKTYLSLLSAMNKQKSCGSDQMLES